MNPINSLALSMAVTDLARTVTVKGREVVQDKDGRRTGHITAWRGNDEILMFRIDANGKASLKVRWRAKHGEQRPWHNMLAGELVVPNFSNEPRLAFRALLTNHLRELDRVG